MTWGTVENPRVTIKAKDVSGNPHVFSDVIRIKSNQYDRRFMDAGTAGAWS